jgi:hypothetical protein
MKRWGGNPRAQRTPYRIYFTCVAADCQEELHKNRGIGEENYATRPKPFAMPDRRFSH